MAYLLVPVETVRTALRIDPGESDTWMTVLTSAASLAVAQYVKEVEALRRGIDSPPLDSPPDSPPDDLSTIDDRIKLAVISLTGVYYREADGDMAKNFAGMGELPYVVTALLYPLRTPTIA